MGRVMLLRYMEGSASTMDASGFPRRDVREPRTRSRELEPVRRSHCGDRLPGDENLLARFKAEDGSLGVDAIYCPNESSSFGCCARSRTRPSREGDLIGFDASEQMVRALEKRGVRRVVLQDPVNMAYLGVKTMVSNIRGEDVPARIDTGVTSSPGQHERPKIAELLRPDVDRWLTSPEGLETRGPSRNSDRPSPSPESTSGSPRERPRPRGENGAGSHSD